MSGADLFLRIVMLCVIPVLVLLVIAVGILRARQNRQELSRLERVITDLRGRLEKTEAATAALPSPAVWYPKAVADELRRKVEGVRGMVGHAKVALTSAEGNFRLRSILCTQMALHDAELDLDGATAALEFLTVERYDGLALGILREQGGGQSSPAGSKTVS